MSMERFFFDNWLVLLRTVVIGAFAYVGLIVILRISGKRTLSKMNAFDFVITIALGSILATILLNKNVTLAEGLTAFALLVVLQFIITWSSVRVPFIRKLVTGEPLLLFYHGDYLPAALQKARITRNEVRAAIRAAGLGALEEAKAVVLETDGSFSVIRNDDISGSSSLIGVEKLSSHKGS